MIEVTIYKDGFTSRGHADFAEYGKDIVCSAVSAITQTASLGLQNLCEADVTIREGFINLRTKQRTYTGDVILQTMAFGLAEVAKEYPNYLQIKGEI